MSEHASQTLRRASTVRRMDALFRAMSSDYLLREQFITGPTEVLSEYLYGRQITSEQAAASNLLIYAVVANGELRSWLHGFALAHRGNVPSGAQFAKDFAAAASQYGDDGVAHALAAAKDQRVNFDEDMLHYICNIGVLSEDGAADGVRPSADAERLADGTLTAVTWSTYITSSTGTGTGTGTDPFTRSPFTAGTHPTASLQGSTFGEFGPGYVMGTLDALTDYATRLRLLGTFEGPR